MRDYELKAMMAATILGAHVIRGQQSDVNVRAAAAVDDAENILKILDSKEEEVPVEVAKSTDPKTGSTGSPATNAGSVGGAPGTPGK